MVDLRPDQLVTIRGILREHVPGQEVWAFGSRVRGNARPFSDLDLLLVAEERLAPGIRAALADAFSAADLPFKVDLAEWSALSPAFRERLAAEHEVLQAPGA